MSQVTRLADHRRARQRRTAYPAPEDLGCFAMAQAVQRQLSERLTRQTEAALRLLSAHDFIPSDTEPT